MRKFILSIMTVIAIMLTAVSCTSIKYMSVQTREPAKIILPDNVHSILVVNNVVTQPDNFGHTVKPINRKVADTSVSADSMSIFYTEALSQFLDEERYFDTVMHHSRPLRGDNDFWKEHPLTPDMISQMKSDNDVDIVISLDKLFLTTDKREHFRQEGLTYANMTAKIQSVIRVYAPTLTGQIPTIQYIDSLIWDGYDNPNLNLYAELVLPTQRQGMKELVVRAAEKMTYAIVPHWEVQDRWFYSTPNSLMKKGEAFAVEAKWQEAIDSWKTYFDNNTSPNNKAKAATNIALAYEMLDDMKGAFQWISTSHELFSQAKSASSLDAKRASLYKIEIERRLKNSSKFSPAQ